MANRWQIDGIDGTFTEGIEMNGENLVKVSAHTLHGPLRDVNNKKNVTIFGRILDRFRRS